MARWGKCDFKEFYELQKRLEKMERERAAFMEDCAKELAARLLARAIKRTPVGQYPAGSGKKGGTLRRGWTAGKQQDAGAYARSLPVNRVGDTYVVDIINPTEYASYVEYGHRTRGGKGWVKGQFMLTKSEIELDRQAPQILEAKIKKYLEEILND